MAVLGEHSDRVNRIIVAPDHTFFVTGGDDGFARVWDSSRLERNVSHRSKSKQSIGEGVRVTSLCFLHSTHAFVCAGSDGTVHFFKVPVSEGGENGPRVGSMQLVRTWQIPNAAQGEHVVWCEHYRGDGGSTLILLTNLTRILVIDVRNMAISFELRNPAQHGTPTCFCIGEQHQWLLVGTNHGILDLWDLRFRVRLRSWIFPKAAPIMRLQLSLPVEKSKSKSRNRVCVAGGTGRGEVSLWDIERLICHEIYRPVATDAPYDAKDYELRNLDDERAEGLLSKVVGDPESITGPFAAETTASFSTMQFAYNPTKEDEEFPAIFAITGGPDNKVRFWDSDGPKHCKVVSGNSADEKTSFTVSSIGLDTKILTEQPLDTAQPAGAVAEMSKSKKRAPSTTTQGGKAGKNETIRTSAQNLLDRHLDTVTDVALLERPFGMILSPDRSGQVFVHQ